MRCELLNEVGEFTPNKEEAKRPDRSWSRSQEPGATTYSKQKLLQCRQLQGRRCSEVPCVSRRCGKQPTDSRQRRVNPDRRTTRSASRRKRPFSKQLCDNCDRYIYIYIQIFSDIIVQKCLAEDYTVGANQYIGQLEFKVLWTTIAIQALVRKA